MFSSRLNKLIEAIVTANPFHYQILQKALICLDSEEVLKLEEYLVFCFDQGLSIDYLARSYNTILADVLRESIYFKQHKKYRYSSCSAVANSVYRNSEYMSLYMHGLLLTLFFWPNHLMLYRFFINTLPQEQSGAYLEIGTGHGFFFKTALERTSYDNFLGIDLSETSLQQTKLLVHDFNRPIQLHCADFLAFPLAKEQFDAIIMGELLEHTEEPAAFLHKINQIAKSGAYIFITTCLNAPAWDHIYQFNDLAELEHLFLQAGFHIKKSCILPYSERSVEECMKHFLPINVGYVLERI